MKSESKEDKFKRIATARTLRVLEDLRLLGNCANKGNYSYTDQYVKRIFDEIQNEIKRTRALFGKSEKHKFSL